MGGKQLGFSDYEQTTAKKRTNTEKFLAEMDQAVPWLPLLDLIEPVYPKVSRKGGRPPYPLATMLRIHLMQQWYSLSDPAMEEALIEVPTMCRFAGIELVRDRIPDETTILEFRHLLEKHDLGQQIFDAVKAHLKPGLIQSLRKGLGVAGAEPSRAVPSCRASPPASRLESTGNRQTAAG
jgi:IS5 family transposase